MEKLIYELNDPGNQSAPDRINQIQQHIQRLQREHSAWQLGLDFLHNDNALIRFYGALTLTIKVNADWHEDGFDAHANTRMSLLESIVTSYVHMVNHNDATFVLQKLCSTMAVIFQKSNSGWPRPIKHLGASVLSKGYIPPEQSPDVLDLLLAPIALGVIQLRGLLLPVLTLVEDVNASVNTEVQSQHMSGILQHNAPDALNLILFCMHSYCKQHGFDPLPDVSFGVTVSQDIPTELLGWGLQALPIWLRFVDQSGLRQHENHGSDNLSIVHKCLFLLPVCLQVEPIAGWAMQALTTLQQVAPSLLKQLSPNTAFEVLATARVGTWLNQLKQGAFNVDPMSLVDYIDSIMEQVDFTTSEYFRSGKYLQLLSMLHELLSCAGTAVIDDPVCHTALDLVSSIVDGFNDWDDKDDLREPMLTFIRSCCEASLQKIRVPETELTQNTQEWDADDRAKFQDFRYDVQDYYQAAFVSLGHDLIDAVVNSAIHMPSSVVDWSSYEACLFILAGFTDTFANEPNVYDSVIGTIFASGHWQLIIQSGQNIPEHVRRTAIKLLSESSAYLERHEQEVVPTLNFLFTSLVSSKSAHTASRAIYAVCDQQRRSLAQALPGFLASLPTLTNIGNDDRHRVYGAVAAIIQALPSEAAKFGPLSQMMGVLGQSLEGFDHGVLDADQQLDCAVDVLRTLAAIGKGLRAPPDSPIEIDATDSRYEADFWTVGAGSSFQSSVLRMYSTVQASTHRVDSSMVEACCDFLRCGYTESHPSPFKLQTHMSLELLCQLISPHSPDIDAVMACATAFLASEEPRTFEKGLAKLLGSVCTLQEGSEDRSDGTRTAGVDISFASSSLDFFARILPKWGDAWFGMENSLQSAMMVTQNALLLLKEQDTLLRRTAASFFTALFNQSGNGVGHGHTANTTLDDLITRIGPSVLGILLNLVAGECQRSELESLTETLRKIVQKQPRLAKSLLREAMKPESAVLSPKALQVTSPEQRARFAAQLDNLRGSRKTNDIVKDFWITCRGSGFAYIA